MYFNGTKYKPGNIIKSKLYGHVWKILDIRPRKNGDHYYKIREVNSDGDISPITMSRRSKIIDDADHYHLSLTSVLKKL